MKCSPFLIVLAAAGLLLNTACSSTPSVRVEPVIPLACLIPCEEEPPPPPPTGSEAKDTKARLMWEIEALEASGRCAALHSDCVREAMRRTQEK